MSHKKVTMDLKEQKKIKRYFSLIFFLLIVGLAMWYVDFNFIELAKSIPVFLGFIFTDFLPPNFSDVKKYVGPVLDTIFVAVIATCVSSFLAMILAIFMASNTTPHPVFRIVCRGIVSFLRSIPFLLWAALLVVVFGVGVLPGLLGLILYGTAFLARVYAESVEELGSECTEAIEAVGATYVHQLKHAIIPQFIPSFFSWTLFMFEINLRGSAILGIVGAGGIGSLIKGTMDLFQYSKTSTVIMILITMILVVEYITTRIRERII